MVVVNRATIPAWAGSSGEVDLQDRAGALATRRWRALMALVGLSALAVPYVGSLGIAIASAEPPEVLRALPAVSAPVVELPLFAIPKLHRPPAPARAVAPSAASGATPDAAAGTAQGSASATIRTYRVEEIRSTAPAVPVTTNSYSLPQSATGQSRRSSSSSAGAVVAHQLAAALSAAPVVSNVPAPAAPVPAGTQAATPSASAGAGSGGESPQRTDAGAASSVPAAAAPAPSPNTSSATGAGAGSASSAGAAPSAPAGSDSAPDAGAAAPAAPASAEASDPSSEQGAGSSSTGSASPGASSAPSSSGSNTAASAGAGSPAPSSAGAVDPTSASSSSSPVALSATPAVATPTTAIVESPSEADVPAPQVVAPPVTESPVDVSAASTPAPLAPAGTGNATPAPAVAAADPTVTLTVPLTTADTCPPSSASPPSPTCLQTGPIFRFSNQTGVTITVSVNTASGTTITSVKLEYAPTGQDDFTNPDYVPQTLKLEPSSSTYALSLDAGLFNGLTGQAPGDSNDVPALDPTGDWDLRVEVTDSDGDTGYSPIETIIVVDDFNSVQDENGTNYYDTYVGLQSPGAAVSGTVSLVAAPWRTPTTALPDNVTFEVAPAGSGNWNAIATVPQTKRETGTQLLTDTTAFDTTTLPDGTYDLTVEAEDSNGAVYVGNIVSVVIDNTPPTVTLANPGTTLSGVVPLSASAQDSGSGVAQVRFEIATSGSGDWSTIGVEPSAPYGLSFDTRGLANGLYDLRAVAIDLAGNVADSQVVSGISIANATAALNPDSFAITDFVVPATHVSLLGAIAGSPDGETWAYGFTTAPPATVDGAPLTYTAPAGGDGQLVLLEYTDTTGWQIADVLRNADGSAYALSSPLMTGNVSGAMTVSGEAWIAVAQNGEVSLFHREPGGEFVLDTANNDSDARAMSTLGSAPTIVLGEDSGDVAYGVAYDTEQSAGSVRTNAGTVNTRLKYAVLVDGSWTVSTAPLPASYVPQSEDTVTLKALAPTGPGTGWGVFAVTPQFSTSLVPEPLFLGSFAPGNTWTETTTGLDALDLTGNFAVGAPVQVTALALSSDADGVWISATLQSTLDASETVVALFDPSTGHVTGSWCGSAVLAESRGCGEPLDANHPATVPDAAFSTAAGTVAVALPGENAQDSGSGPGFIDVYAYGQWTSVAAPGFSQNLASTTSEALFNGPQSGWLSGTYSLAQITSQAPTSPLAIWPQANANTLVSVALPPAGAGIGTSGALAVGLDGVALHYDASAGWLVDAVPVDARSADLLGVAFDGPDSAVAVGSFGTILDWNGSAWSADPQSTEVTQYQLNAVAFASDGEGWAVGDEGTILHFDGTAWSPEQLDAADSGSDLSSVTVAGDSVYALAGGDLIERNSDGTWSRVDPSLLPASLASGALSLVSGLADGGLVAAGPSLVLIKQNASSNLAYSAQPIDGNPVALSAFRDRSTGQVGAFVSVAPPAHLNPGESDFPAGDGELLKLTGSELLDLSESQYPNTTVPLDGAAEPDPVLAVAAALDGSAAWAVGGYAGTPTASGLGSDLPVQSRPTGWQTASIWRYDAGGSATAPSLQQAQVTINALPGVVSFAFFSSPLCEDECAAVDNAQPDVNLEGAAAEIAAFAQQPGGPAFAVLGGDAVGPIDGNLDGRVVDLANIQRYLSGLGSVPLYPVYGSLDGVSTDADPAQPWTQAFAQEPAPFGLGALPAGITPLSAGGSNDGVNLYYSFAVTQNGGTLMVIVLDNAAGSLEASAPGQTAWLDGQLVAGRAAGLPMVVFCAEPLNSAATTGHASDADQVGALLADNGVLAVFTTSITSLGAGTNPTLDSMSMIPGNAGPDAPQIPEYEGASLGYQNPSNNGVLWYFVSVDTNADTVNLQGIPVIQSLALEPLSGLTVPQSSTLSFAAVGERPAGTIPSNADSTGIGYENYVSIPAAGCSSCVTPSYTFTSQIPGIGTFVQPAGIGSLFPLLDANGNPIRSSKSGLFCAFNAGTTLVSVTSGLLTAQLPVTVESGEIGEPCGTVIFPPDIITQDVAGPTVYVTSTSAPGQLNVGVPISPSVALPFVLPAITIPPPPPPTVVAAPAPAPPPLPVVVPVIVPQQVAAIVPTLAAALVPLAVVPPIAPPITPVPPGGATAPAQSTAKREERARKHASQSAYVIRPAGTSADLWFFPAVGITGLIAIVLAASGLAGPRQGRVELAWEPIDNRRRRKP